VLLALIGALVIALLVKGAETPVGIGNGQVPELIGRDLCSATTAVAERGLRWRIIGGREARSDGLRPSRQDSFDCTSDRVVRQTPERGTRLDQGDVIALVTVCSDPLRPVGCL
jgi:beta-lactam-binding protein with PASTA domain